MCFCLARVIVIGTSDYLKLLMTSEILQMLLALLCPLSSSDKNEEPVLQMPSTFSCLILISYAP